MEKFYKALRVDKGVLKSVWAGNPTSCIGGRLRSLTMVTYEEGRIAYAPVGQKGLATFKKLEVAVSFCKINKGCGSPMVIHEATPLGQEGIGLMGGTGVTYPAILLGKEVWTDKPKEPTELERFEEAEKLFGGEIKRGVLYFSLHFCPKGRSYHLYAAKDGWILYDGDAHRVARKSTLQEVAAFIEQDKPRPEPKFKVGARVLGTGGIFRDNTYIVEAVEWTDFRYEYKLKDSSIAFETNLKLAPPKEEWVDVTKECVVDMCHSVGKQEGSLIRFRIGGRTVVEFGNGGEPWLYLGYKVETADPLPTKNFNWFKILKKVVK